MFRGKPHTDLFPFYVKLYVARSSITMMPFFFKLTQQSLLLVRIVATPSDHHRLRFEVVEIVELSFTKTSLND